MLICCRDRAVRPRDERSSRLPRRDRPGRNRLRAAAQGFRV